LPNSEYKENKMNNFKYIITTIIAIIGIVVYFFSPPSAKPNEKLLSIEFNRIAASDTLPYFLKMMEGGVLREAEGFPGQYRIEDEKGNIYGLLTSKFEKLWGAWQFKNQLPLNNKLWQDISGNDYSNNAIGFINTKVQTDKYKNFDEYAKYYICFFYDSSLNEDTFGLVEPSAVSSVYGTDMDSDKLCDILNNDPYSFYYTAATISNISDKNMYNIKIHIKENNKIIKIPFIRLLA